MFDLFVTRSTLKDLKDRQVTDGIIHVVDAGGGKLIQASERFMSSAFKNVTFTVCGTALAITVIIVLFKSRESDKRRE